jgi:hypothetical protein
MHSERHYKKKATSYYSKKVLLFIHTRGEFPALFEFPVTYPTSLTKPATLEMLERAGNFGLEIRENSTA